MNEIIKILEVKEGYIQDAPAEYAADTIVNAANPTLMGSDQGVDKAIHTYINDKCGRRGYLKSKIKEVLDSRPDEMDDMIRCERGKVVITPGYSLCGRIMHTVGPKSDAGSNFFQICSSSRISILESCYRNIILEALANPEIRKVAVPVISSGNYGMEFEMAFRTGLAAVYNTLLDMKQRDLEFFEYNTLEKVYFIIPGDDRKQLKAANDILNYYKKYFGKERRVIARSSFVSQFEFLREIWLYDEQKGYFSVAKMFRMILVILRMFCFPATYLKDIFGRRDWVARRKAVEIITISKMLLPFAVYLLLKACGNGWGFKAASFIMLYNLLDTTTYLLSLIILADIQRPSANIIRSVIMLCMNYIEIAMEISILYYIHYYGKIMFRDAMAFGLLGKETGMFVGSFKDYAILYLNQGVKFFFITLTFGYFANHLRQRKFRQL